MRRRRSVTGWEEEMSVSGKRREEHTPFSGKSDSGKGDGRVALEKRLQIDLFLSNPASDSFPSSSLGVVALCSPSPLSFSPKSS